MHSYNGLVSELSSVLDGNVASRVQIMILKRASISNSPPVADNFPYRKVHSPAPRRRPQIPLRFSNLKFLHSHYIQNNQFSGGFPPALHELTRLTHLDLSDSNFTGEIPFSVNNLKHLMRLFMGNNKFSGPQRVKQPSQRFYPYKVN